MNYIKELIKIAWKCGVEGKALVIFVGLCALIWTIGVLCLFSR